jgi:HPt (histidine-containing phosphotransfer) domain-containing protein
LFCDVRGIRWRLTRMPGTPPPNKALADLAAVLGDDNVRTLVRTYLREFPLSIQNLGGGERRDRHRMAHSMKSNSRLVGAIELSQRMAELELRLADANGRDVSAEEITSIKAQFETVAAPLRAFVGEGAP